MPHERSKAIFTNLILSAFKFFERSIDTFDAEVDASIIHFATALELTLKAQLALEHWAFIFNEMKNINLKELESGTLTSVKASELMKRINALLPNEIKGHELKAYESVFSHRNRVLHYVHEGLFQKDEILSIKKTFLTAWHYLHQRLENRLFEHLAQKQRIGLIPLFNKMSEKEGIWSVIYAESKELLENLKTDETLIRKCKRCGQDSLVRKEESTNSNMFKEISELCVVCRYSEQINSYKCQKCQTYTDLSSEEVCCQKCGNKILCASNHAHIEICEHSYEPIYCGICGNDNLYYLEDKYYCNSCGELSDKDWWTCAYCNTSQTGDVIDDSYISGCIACNGKLGNLSDKD